MAENPIDLLIKSQQMALRLAGGFRPERPPAVSGMVGALGTSAG